MKNHSKNRPALVLALVAGFVLTACAPLQFTNPSQQKPQGPQEKTKGYCEVDPVDFNVSVSISEFAVTDTGGAQLFYPRRNPVAWWQFDNHKRDNRDQDHQWNDGDDAADDESKH